MPCVWAKRRACDWRSGAALRNAGFSPPHGWARARVPQRPLPAFPLPVGFPRTKRPPTGNTAPPSMSLPAAAASIAASCYAVCPCAGLLLHSSDSERRAAAARQAPIGNRTASAKRKWHGKRRGSSTASEGAVRQAPSGRSTASAERGQHGERRTRAARQASRGSGTTSAERTGTKQMLNYRPRHRWALHRLAQSMGVSVR